MSKRLLVITEELPAELRQAGADGAIKGAYYNPDGFFDKVALIDWGRGGDWPELPHAVLHLPPDAGVESWLNAVQSADFSAVMGDEISEGWPGVPESWLAAIRQFGPTCVRAYGVRWSGWVAQHIADALSIPSLCSIHNITGLCTPVLKRAPLLIAVGETVATAAIAAGADPARVVTVHNRVDRSVFTPEGESAPGPEGSPRLLSVARDVEQKNLDRLLQACELARRDHLDLRLVHIGRSARDWSAWPFVTHIDSVPQKELPAWMRWADALVLPSLWEGFVVVAIEALACGTPVITSNRDSMAEAVIDRWNGLLVNPEDTSDIARAIRQIADPGVQARLAAPARTASEPYAIEAIGRREAALYRWVLEPQRPRVTVVMPTYNRAELAERSVRNLLDQDYPALDLVVVNDGSSDGTRQRLDWSVVKRNSWV